MLSVPVPNLSTTLTECGSHAEENEQKNKKKFAKNLGMAQLKMQSHKHFMIPDKITVTVR